ncbi:MAG: hypothetical protein FWG47_02075 [Propionibacteriaceae bacterium]|nr:hypothetical protein [Propionibacteriaceae bacterium]
MPDSSIPLVFLDANILAKPVTRSLLMFAAPGSYSVIWSTYVEHEAERHLRGRQASLAKTRQLAQMEPHLSSKAAGDYAATSVSDRQVLADAVETGAVFIVTEDVDDFGEPDLIATGISAVNPDLFLAERATTGAFYDAVVRMAAPMTTPPRTPNQLYARLGRQHPRAVAAHHAAFCSAPMPPTHHPPAIGFRGKRCLRCLNIVEQIADALCTDCRSYDARREAQAKVTTSAS